MKTLSKIILISLVVGLAGFYLYQTGDLINSYYLVKKYRLQIEDMTAKNLTLQAQAAEFSSFDNIESKIGSMNFEKVTEVKYLSAKGQALAAKK